ncbi:hypothetical protein [Fluviicola taffensis]|uniref:Uncharacterized protein n=1 Tax=Fluviicola taffensis (strain DSM 16823 / NCIMB 13979 / RW262) TaxID=755732 RepID=F2IG11_FLUTR|nr:hypothetical protein [Fluviicola taffensis]AEA43632.1 hypothetical protein Fluta_1640 [Fluviicola taffensis DSM 16823]
MKSLFFLVLTVTCFLPTHFWAQEVKVTDEVIQFSSGIHEAVVVTIPFGKREAVEAQLKSELKSWKGKLSITGDEYVVIQGRLKAMGDKRHDTHAKIIESVNEIKVAFAVDLGGKFVNRMDHPTEYKHIYERVRLFGNKASAASVQVDLDTDKKALKSLEKEEKKLEKEIASSKKDVENYQKKIVESEKKIQTKQTELTAKQAEIKTQNAQITDRKKTVKKLK